MKLKVLFISFVLFASFDIINAQETEPCINDQLLGKWIEDNPRYPNPSELISYGTRRWREKNSNLRFYPKPNPTYCDNCVQINPGCFKSNYALPVIVHIVAQPNDLTEGLGSNIPEIQIKNAIDNLNRQFAGFGQQDVRAANTGIQFYLPPVGPDSNGIFRYNSSLSTCNITNLALTDLRNLIPIAYNTQEYIHIFVVDTITNQGVMGYASYPETGINHGIIIKRQRFGNSLEYCAGCELVSDSRNKTLAHEMGHFLGLRHTFEGGCAPAGADCEVQGDGCCDTPPIQEANFYCPTNTNSCPTDLREDQIENFMDYTSETCAKWFTYDQAQRMHYTIETYKKELTNIDFLINYNPDICMFSANFKIVNPTICDTGDVVKFRAIPYTNTGVKYIWTIYDSIKQTIASVSKIDEHEWEFFIDAKGKYDIQLQVIYDKDTAIKYMSESLWVTSCESAVAHEGGNWFFGQYAGLVFTEAGVRPSLEAAGVGSSLPTINANEGSVSISDKEGNLMFYAGGMNHAGNRGVVYNSNHQATNSGFWEGYNISNNCAQPAVVFPYPNDTGKTMMLHSSTLYEGNLYYSILYKHPNGLYDTLFNYKNIPVTIAGIMQNNDNAIDAGENLTVVAKCYGVGYWLATTVRFGKNKEDYYLAIISIDTNGFQLVDTMLVPGFDGANLHYGQGKFSPDATKYATFNNIYNFDRATGKLMHLAELPFPNYLIYGLSFSPNSRYLYWIGENEDITQNLIRRVDLSFNNPLSYIQDIGIAPNNASWQAMQLGPDNRLYIANVGSSELAVINHPDADWSKVHHNPLGYEPYGVPLQIGGMGGVSVMGLPNQIDAKRIEVIKDTIYYTIKDCNTVVFSSTACCRGSYLWMFGDGDTSLQKYPDPHYYNKPGTYVAKLILDSEDTISVLVSIFTPKIRILGDTLLCNENQYATYTALEIDSFSKNFKLDWDVISGTYLQHHSMSNTIVPSFDLLPAQIIVKITDPTNECEARDTININKTSLLIQNKINYNIAKMIVCSDTFKIKGDIPQSDSLYNFLWYYSFNNEDWYEMDEHSSSLSTQYINKATYFKRLIYPDACENWSNVVKVVPGLSGNNIYALHPLIDGIKYYGHFGGEYMYLDIRSDTVISMGDISEEYYYKWQVSDNGWIFNDLSPFFSSQVGKYYDLNYYIYLYYNKNRYQKFLDRDVQKLFYKKIVANGYCTDHSNIVKAINYNLPQNKSISFLNQNHNIIHGEIPIEPDTLFKVVWQYSLNGIDWTNIQTGYSHDTLWNASNYHQKYIRRVIEKKFHNQEYYYDGDTLISNELVDKSNFFLWLRDLPSDTAKEPNNEVVMKNDYFSSPDIAATNTQNIKFGSSTFLTVNNNNLDFHIKIRNKGTDTSRRGELFLYASLDGLNPEWNFSFTDTVKTVTVNQKILTNTYHDTLTNKLETLGTPVNLNGIIIPPVPPNEEITVSYHWSNPPEHFLQSRFSYPGGNKSNVKRSVIYLARIIDHGIYPYNMTLNEFIFDNNITFDNTTKKNIANNARIAALHSYTLPIKPVMTPYNPMEFVTAISLNVSSKSVYPFKINVDIDSADLFFDNADFYIFFDAPLWEAFVNSGFSGSGFTLVRDGVFKVNRNFNNIFWDNLLLDEDDVGQMGFSFYYTPSADTSGLNILSKFKITMEEDGYEKGALTLYADSKLSGAPLVMSSIVPSFPSKNKEVTDIDSNNNNIIKDIFSNEIDTDKSFIFNSYPNPFSDELVVIIKDYDANSFVYLSDINGRIIYKRKLDKSETYSELRIPTNKYAEGVYIITYESELKKIVKKTILLR